MLGIAQMRRTRVIIIIIIIMMMMMMLMVMMMMMMMMTVHTPKIESIMLSATDPTSTK